MTKSTHKYGFTLVELILVSTILVIVGMAVYGTFASGLNIWKRITVPAIAEDVGIFFDKISFDLRNSFKMDGLKFRGGMRSLSIPTLVKYTDKEYGAYNTVGQITYSFDRKKKLLKKKEANYSEIFRKKSARESILAEGISSLEFSYYVYDSQQKMYKWVSSWQERDPSFGAEIEDNLPLIVRIEVGFQELRGERSLVKTVMVPSACCWPVMEDKSL